MQRTLPAHERGFAGRNQETPMTNPFTRKHRRLSERTKNAGLRRDIQQLQLDLNTLRVRVKELEESETRANRIREEVQRHKLRTLNPAIAM